VKIILDSNLLLLLLIVGSTDRTLITRHKRLRSYIHQDFDLLIRILTAAQNIIVTPNTLTETSNLAGYIDDPARSAIYNVFRALLDDPIHIERAIESKSAVYRPEFTRLGLTDSVLLQLGAESHTLLTADVDLYLAACAQGFKAENFNHYRDL
jgi:hypothetical protein